MAKTIAIVNQKGGVGKTTTAINLGAYLSWLGNFVLLIDLDPQANATSALGINPQELEHGIYNCLIGQQSLRDVVVQTQYQGFKVAPATADLAGARVEMVDMEDREFQLSNALLEVSNDYDYIIIDCPPSMDMLTINGLVASDEVLIPVQAEYLALEGLGQLLSSINMIRENLRPQLTVMGAVVTMYDKRNKLSGQVVNELRQHFPAYVFNVVIPRNVRLTESPSHGQTILSYDPRSKGAKAYEDLTREIMNLLAQAQQVQ